LGFGVWSLGFIVWRLVFGGFDKPIERIELIKPFEQFP
jgi:hypothetical protein